MDLRERESRDMGRNGEKKTAVRIIENNFLKNVSLLLVVSFVQNYILHSVLVGLPQETESSN